MSLKITRG